MTQDIPPDAADRARALFGDLIQGRWEKARRNFNVRLRDPVDTDPFANGWRDMADSAGSFERIGTPVARQSGDYTVVGSAIPWKRGHFPLADSCDFGRFPDYRTPVHLRFLASACALGTDSPDAPRTGPGRLAPARVSCRRGRRGLRGHGRPRRGRRRQCRVVKSVQVINTQSWSLSG